MPPPRVRIASCSPARIGQFDANLIDTVFLNFDEFRKEGAGTWRLTGAADATGRWRKAR